MESATNVLSGGTATQEDGSQLGATNILYNASFDALEVPAGVSAVSDDDDGTDDDGVKAYGRRVREELRADARDVDASNTEEAEGAGGSDEKMR